MTHNENIKFFYDVSSHLELEAERLEAAMLKIWPIWLSLVHTRHLSLSAGSPNRDSCWTRKERVKNFSV